MLDSNPNIRFANSSKGLLNLRVIANRPAGTIQTAGVDVRKAKCWSRRGELGTVSWRLNGTSSPLTIGESSIYSL